MTNGSLMKVKSIAECPLSSKVLQNAPLGAFCNTFDLHLAIISLENQFLVFESGHFTQVLLYVIVSIINQSYSILVFL